jgi:thioredoxin reductase
MNPVQTDVLIIGAGPGGLQLAHELHRAGADYLVLDGGDAPGSFFRHYPRHRQLISINRPNVGHDPGNPLRFDWNSLLNDDPTLQFTRYSPDYFPQADDYLRYLADFAGRHELAIRYRSPVTAVESTGETFTVTVDGNVPISARRVVMATGVVLHLPAIPGIELAERYDAVTTDPAGFRDARVLIVGKGNSGFETASNLIPTAGAIHLVSPTPLRLAWATHYVGHLRAVNNDLLDTYHLKVGNAVIDAEVTAIRRVERDDRGRDGYEVDLAYTHAAGQRVTYRYDRVVAATGFRFDPSPLAGLAPERSREGRLPAMTSDYRSVSVPGLYFAGTLMQARDHGKTASGFIHGFRYNIRFLAKVLVAEGNRLPADAEVPGDAATLAHHVLARLNHSSGLFLQPGYLADVYLARDAGQLLGLHTEVPLDWVREGGVGTGWRLVVTLEYGPKAPDPFNVERSPEPWYARLTPYLHPVIRVLQGEKEVDRLDLLEDLDNRYHAEQFLPHLLSFFGKVLGDRQVHAG